MFGGALGFRCGLGSAVVILRIESYPAVALCRFRPPWEEGKRRLKLYSAADQLGRLCGRLVVDCPKKGLL